MQISISDIENGYIIGTPPEPSVIERAQRQGREARGVMTHATNFRGVVEALKALFPSEETRNILITDVSQGIEQAAPPIKGLK